MIIKVRKSIANIYYTLRNICGFIMLAGLIFTGIRILLSANIPTKRTQYLMLMQDWLIGMVLLIFSHIIMIGIFYVSDTLTDALSMSLNGFGGLNATLVSQCLASWDSAEQIICLVMLGYMIYLTVIFAIAYFKRFLWICVLTAFAPIVSTMYAFGQQTKQIYSSWIREYIMTVLVQPFHLIIYWVLVSIPLDIVNSTGGFSFGSGFFEIIYALVAISFIRPAEAYMRQLFGMDKGIARMASFDSGKQTFDAVKKAIEDVVKKIAMVAAVAVTGGAAAGVVGAAGATGGATAGVVGAAGGEGTALASGVEATAATEGGEGFLSNIMDTGLNSSLIDADTSMPRLNSNNLSPDQRLKGADLSGKLQRGEISESNLSDNEKDLVKAYNENSNSKPEDKLTNAAEKLTQAAETLNNAARNTNNDIEIVHGNSPAVNSEETEGSQGRFRRMINKPIGIINDINSIARGEKSAFDVISDAYNNTWLGKKYKAVGNGIKGTGAFQKLEGTEIYQKAKEKMSSGIDIAKAFEKSGGAKDLYKGFNEIRDTFFATPPPQDWKKTVEGMDAKQKEKNEQKKYNFVNNEGNQQFIIEQKGYIEKFRAQYPDKTRYSDAYIENLAKEKAKGDLKSMADNYIPMGVEDVGLAYELEQDRKKYGYSSEEALYKRAEFEKFNANLQNTQHINSTYNVNVSKVSEAIPNAREYYNNGYNNIADLSKVDWLQQKLNTSLEMAMKMDNVLKRNGKVNYKGNDPSMKKIYDEINQQYNDRQGD